MRIFVGALSMALLASSPTMAQQILHPDDRTFVGLGKLIYDAQCASCHGAELEGAPNWRQRRDDGRMPAPPHDETGHTWHHPELQLFEITKYGLQRFAGADYETDMPAYEELLSDAEIIAVLSYIKSTWPGPIRSRHDAMSQ